MRKIYFSLIGITFSAIVYCQPECIPSLINPADTVLVSQPPCTSLAQTGCRRVHVIRKTNVKINVDGQKDDIWAAIDSMNIDRFIICRTNYIAGVYACTPEEPFNRTPDNKTDFSGYSKIIYDDDYLYLLFDITDNEVNDGVINMGVQERIEIVVAPYPDSAQELLKGKPYPPYPGGTDFFCNPKDTNLYKRFIYWPYFGAFKFKFVINPAPAVTILIDEIPDTSKINYYERVAACHSAWKMKDDKSGYILEAALSLKVALADSANKPYTIDKNEQSMAFDVFPIDKDYGQNQIKASWNAQDDEVSDFMLYTGKLRFLKSYVGVDNSIIENVKFSPNPATDVITFSQKVSKAEIYSITGVLMSSGQNTEQLDVSGLQQGLYLVKADGEVIGKLMKE
jgi:hypothetical protein